MWAQKTLTLLDPAGRTLSTKPLPAVEQAKTIEASSAINVATIPPKTLVPCSAPALELTAPAVETGPELEAAFTDVAFSSAVLTLPSASLKVISEALARLSPKLRKGLHSIGRAPISGPRPSHGIRCSDGHVLLDSDLSIIDDGQRKHLMRAIAFCAALGIVREQDSSDAWIKKWQALWEAATQTPPGSPRSFLHPLGRRSVALDVAITVSEILADPDAVAFVRLDQGLLDQRMGLLLEAGLIDADQLARARCKSDSDAVVLRLAVAGIAAKLPVYINGQTIATLPAQKEAGYQRVALRLSSSALKLRSIGNRLVINVVSAEGDIDDIQLFGLSFVGRYGVAFSTKGHPSDSAMGPVTRTPTVKAAHRFICRVAALPTSACLIGGTVDECASDSDRATYMGPPHRHHGDVSNHWLRATHHQIRAPQRKRRHQLRGLSNGPRVLGEAVPKLYGESSVCLRRGDTLAQRIPCSGLLYGLRLYRTQMCIGQALWRRRQIPRWGCDRRRVYVPGAR
jgi:hypothetical protein